MLVPIAEYYRPSYEETLRQRHAERVAELRRLVKNDKLRRAAELFDGTRRQGDVAAEIGLAKSSLSDFVSRLREANLLTEAAGQIGPKLAIDPKEVDWDRGKQRRG